MSNILLEMTAFCWNCQAKVGHQMAVSKALGRQVGPGMAFWGPLGCQVGFGMAVSRALGRQVGPGMAVWGGLGHQVGSGMAVVGPLDVELALE